MDDRHLPSITKKAIELIVQYRDGRHFELTELEYGLVKERVKKLLPLKRLVRDPDVANIEIVSDAAMSFVELYNHDNPGNALKQRWVYNITMALTTIDFKPAFVEGEVKRFSVVPADNEEDCTQLVSHANSHHQAAQACDDNTTKLGGSTSAKKGEAWTNREIKKLIKLKIRGLTHKQVACKLGRTESSCATRYSMVLKRSEWLNFAETYRRKVAAGDESGSEAEEET